MKGKIIITVVITFIFTTIFWFVIGLAINSANSTVVDENGTAVDYSKAIEGKWNPVELAEKK